MNNNLKNKVKYKISMYKFNEENKTYIAIMKL